MTGMFIINHNKTKHYQRVQDSKWCKISFNFTQKPVILKPKDLPLKILPMNQMSYRKAVF